MNWGQFKDPLCYLFPHSTVVSPRSLMKDVIGSRFLQILQNSFREKSNVPFGELLGHQEFPISIILLLFFNLWNKSIQYLLRP